MAAVSQAIACRSGQSLAAQDLRPVLEGQVRGHDHTLPLIGRADHVEQECALSEVKVGGSLLLSDVSVLTIERPEKDLLLMRFQ